MLFAAQSLQPFHLAGASRDQRWQRDYRNPFHDESLPRDCRSKGSKQGEFRAACT
jgi:hypothetical protein